MYKTMRNTILDDDTCLVCGAETSGLHFQVNVCRACAAFFRRSVKARKMYRCRRGTRNCELTKIINGRPICRFCRLQKCYQVGMRYDANEKDNGQSTPEVITSRKAPFFSTASELSDSPPRQRSPDDFEPQISQMSQISSESQGPNGCVKRSMHPIVEKVKSILSQEFPPSMYNAPHGVHMTPLQQLQYGFACFSDMVKPEVDKVEIAEIADKLESFKFQEDYCIKAAELAMCCEPFAKLPFNDKWLLFRHYWCAFYALERIYSTIEIFGYDIDDTKHLVTSRYAADENTVWEIIGIPVERSREFIRFCKPLKDNMIQNIANPMKMIRVTRFEVVYMLAQMLWSVYEVKGLSEHAKSIGEGVLEQISSELHNFYSFDMHLTNYASRHAKIIRLLSVAEHQVQLYKDYFTMAKIFNIFEYDLYESELIE